MYKVFHPSDYTACRVILVRVFLGRFSDSIGLCALCVLCGYSFFNRKGHKGHKGEKTCSQSPWRKPGNRSLDSLAYATDSVNMAR